MVIVILRPTHEGKPRTEANLPHGREVDFRIVEASPEAGPYLLQESGAAGVYVLGDCAGDSRNDCPGSRLPRKWSEENRNILARALELDLPVLAVGDGLLLLNEVFGGKSPEDAVEDDIPSAAPLDKPDRRTIYVSPGSKTAAILGAGGFFRLGGPAPSPKLMDGRRAPRLLASAYDVEDGAVEGLESAEHGWVIGFRADLASDERLPRGFGGIFQGFVERAEGFYLAHAVP